LAGGDVREWGADDGIRYEHVGAQARFGEFRAKEDDDATGEGSGLGFGGDGDGDFEAGWGEGGEAEEEASHDRQLEFHEEEYS